MLRHFVFSSVAFAIGCLITVILGISLEGITRIYFKYILKAPEPPLSFSYSTPSGLEKSNRQGNFRIPSTIATQKKFPPHPMKRNLTLIDKFNVWHTSIKLQGVIALKPSSTSKFFIREKGTHREIARGIIETDEVGRRSTPVQGIKHRDQHIIFMGCSYVFGEGVSQDETLPFYTGVAASKYRPYNLGISGGNIADAWAFLEVLDLTRNISERRGLAVYVYIDDHISRFSGNLAQIAFWIHSRPYIRPKSQDEVEFYPSWKVARPGLVWLAQLLDHSYFLRWIRFNFAWITKTDIEHYAQVIRLLKMRYLQRFDKENRFIVLIYPGENRFSGELIKWLEKYEIEYLDYSQFPLNQLSSKPMHIEFDGHPNANAHKIVAQQLKDDLKLN